MFLRHRRGVCCAIHACDSRLFLLSRRYKGKTWFKQNEIIISSAKSAQNGIASSASGYVISAFIKPFGRARTAAESHIKNGAHTHRGIIWFLCARASPPGRRPKILFVNSIKLCGRISHKIISPEKLRHWIYPSLPNVRELLLAGAIKGLLLFGKEWNLWA